jgi:hypothetical protein
MIGAVIGVVVVLIVFAFRFRQMSRSTPYDLNRALIYPIVIAAMAAWFAYSVGPHGMEWLWLALAVLVGGGLGWLRASTVTMSVDHATGRLMAQGSLVAILFLLGLFAVRTVLRMVLSAEASVIGLRPIMADVIFVFMAVGLLAARSAEMNIRGRKLLAIHRANPQIETTEAAGV